MKNNKALAEAEAEANKLGISYGVYVAYMDSGYLETFKRMKAAEDRKIPDKVYESNIIGGKSLAARKRTRLDQKL